LLLCLLFVGSVVLRDCSGDLSTTCKPCPPGTFISEPNGLHNCLTCRNCDESQGLYIQSKCTTIKDTMCDVLDGYHCIDYSDSQCRHAQKHSVCEPGQETKRPGTKTLDTICVNCPQGFFSPSGLNCTKWTDCTSRNEIQTEIGSSVKDVTCTQKRRGRYGLILPVALTPLFSIILCLWLMYKSFYHFLSIGSTCGPNEYRSAYGECCPMCNLGSVVRSDCSGDLSTTCQPCPPGTFMSEPNGLHRCFTCKHCAESQGLYIQSKCTTIQNTICDVLDGYYCIDYSDSQCRHAEKHRVCRPGQETKTAGTKASDTECVDCAPGFYSPSGLNCIKWTDCAARNEIQTEDGSPVKDVTCEQKPKERYGLVDLIATTFTEFYRILSSEGQ
ncbi:hypothetical protein cypCar_00012862, partial [Cyprinus carpio]